MSLKKSTSEYRMSLKVKWELGTALGALLIFALLTFVLFQSFTSDLLKREQSSVNRSLVSVEKRLASSDSKLTNKHVQQLIRASDGLADRTEKSNTTEGVINGLSVSDLSITVYDPSGQQIFTTAGSNKSRTFQKTSKKTVSLVKTNSRKSIVGRIPVYQNKTNKLTGYIQVTSSLRGYYQVADRLLMISMLVLVLVVIASGLLGYVLSYFLLRPIDEIHDTVSRIRDDPTDNHRVPKMHRNDELSDLGNMFNEMLDRMQRYIEQQSQFVEDVSHELRTPVAIIQGHMEMLNRWGKDDPKILSESLDASLKETKRMQDLVQEMLDLSRAEQVEINFRDEKTDVGEVVHQVYNNFKMIHPDFVFTIDDDLKEPTIAKIYRDHLEQILIILCDNAVKYSTTRKEIHLSLSRTLNNVEIGVQDFGEGISQDNMDKVFNRFYRVDKARSRKKGGNGLGLSIAKRLIEGYHGDIALESSAGYGSLFKVTLPVIKEDVQSLDD